MGDLWNYDETDPASIERYAQKLIGKTFLDICNEDKVENSKVVREAIDYEINHENRNRKGGLGEIVEERFFHYPCNNDSSPDFEKAGVELKVTPYKINKNGSYSAKERLIITMIDYNKVVDEKFEDSHLWQKARLILIIFYLYREEIENRLDYKIGYARLFTPPAQDIQIIRHDFETIVKKIRAGKAHELSEADTLYLGAAPKAASSKDRRKQPYSSEPAKPRAFAFKNSYMTYVLNNYIIKGKTTYEPIIKGNITGSFERYVVNKISQYKGYTVEDLCEKFEIKYGKKPKNLEAMLAFRILGVKGNHAEEFEKANIVVKTIRITKNNSIEQHMSFPTFKFKELIEEEWDTSTFGRYLSETRFLFVIFKADRKGMLHLMGCQFWNIPYKDLQGEVRDVWLKTQKVLLDGLEKIN